MALLFSIDANFSRSLVISGFLFTAFMYFKLVRLIKLIQDFDLTTSSNIILGNNV
jgi:hypothetical protein